MYMNKSKQTNVGLFNLRRPT